MLLMMSQNDKSDAGREEVGVRLERGREWRERYRFNRVPLQECHSRRMFLVGVKYLIRAPSVCWTALMHLFPRARPCRTKR